MINELIHVSANIICVFVGGKTAPNTWVYVAAGGSGAVLLILVIVLVLLRRRASSADDQDQREFRPPLPGKGYDKFNNPVEYGVKKSMGKLKIEFLYRKLKSISIFSVLVLICFYKYSIVKLCQS